MQASKLQNIKLRYSIVGNSEALNRAIEIATLVAPTELSVLIEGESGVGKEVIPRIIHDNSLRKSKKLLTINCGAIPEGTIDSELFGHEKGAFTGAIADREGYFGAADGGTLFMDEVGELPLATQARLLRVLETGEYIRVGSDEIRKTNVRIVAATNVNMKKAITEGKFREDLYYRLATVTIKMPPLRERGQDIELIFRKFANDFADKYNTEPIRLNEAAKRLLTCFRWPGNVRQLKNVAEQLSVISTSKEITPEQLRMAGVTNDEGAGTSLMVINPKSSAHIFEEEHAVIFQAIGNLAKEINAIKERLDTINPHSNLKSQISTLPSQISTLAEEAVDISTIEEK